MMGAKRLILYSTRDGREPFREWHDRLRDRAAAMRIDARLDRVEQGNLGDHKALGDGVFELRLHFGPGYRVYFGQEGDAVVLLLCGGDKDSQTKDIERAKVYWADWLESTERKETT